MSKICSGSLSPLKATASKLYGFCLRYSHRILSPSLIPSYRLSILKCFNNALYVRAAFTCAGAPFSKVPNCPPTSYLDISFTEVLRETVKYDIPTILSRNSSTFASISDLVFLFKISIIIPFIKSRNAGGKVDRTTSSPFTFILLLTSKFDSRSYTTFIAYRFFAIQIAVCATDSPLIYNR